MTQSPNHPDGADQDEDAPATESEMPRAENFALKELITGLQSKIAELERRLIPIVPHFPPRPIIYLCMR
jgi:hypothetical protein